MKLSPFILAAALLMNPFPAMGAHAAKHYHHRAGAFVCAKKIGRWLRNAGRRSSGSNFARSYFAFPHVPRSKAQPYDVLVYWRKGRASDGSPGAHVQLVMDHGAHTCKNPGSYMDKIKPCHIGGVVVRTGRG